jgi:hypothetical protein
MNMRSRNNPQRRHSSDALCGATAWVNELKVSKIANNVTCKQCRRSPLFPKTVGCGYCGSDREPEHDEHTGWLTCLDCGGV